MPNFNNSTRIITNSYKNPMGKTLLVLELPNFSGNFSNLSFRKNLVRAITNI